MQPLISIQILNWNRAEETQRAIASALDQSYNNIEVILVDNGSTDNSIEITSKNYPEIKIVELDKNYGCPEGRNRGLKYCNGEYIFYLDNDGVLHRDAVLNAYKSISENENVGIIGGVIYDFMYQYEIDTKCLIKNNIKYYYNNFSGGICLHDKRIYKKTGYYPSHFIYGAEELFLSLKAIQFGYKIIIDESVILWHKKSIVARNHVKEILHSYYNKLYIAIALYPVYQAIKFTLFFSLMYTIYSIRDKIFKEFLFSFPKNYLKTLYLGAKHRDAVALKTYKLFKRKYQVCNNVDN